MKKQHHPKHPNGKQAATVASKTELHLDKKEKGSWVYELLGVAIILLLGTLIYSNSFDCSFQFDGNYTILHNDKIRHLDDFQTIWNSSPNRPVAYLTFAINYYFSGYDVHAWHLTNLSIHLIAALLVWWLTSLIFATPFMRSQPISKHKRWIGFLMALLFVTHPLATQSVTYIVQRMTSLVALFYFLSLALYLKGRLSDQNRILRVVFFIASFGAALLAMKTKETAFTLPFSVLVLEFYFFPRDSWEKYLRDYRIWAGFIVLIGLVLMVPLRYSLSIFKPIIPVGHPEAVLTPYYYLITQFSVIVKYLQLLVLPIHQNLDYDYPIATSIFQVKTLFSFLFLVALFATAIYLFKRQRLISFGIVWFFLTISVTSSVIPINDVIFEHRTYLPSFGFFLVVLTLFYFVSGDSISKLVPIFIGVVSLIFGYLTYERNKVWKDDLTLWSDVVAKSPTKARALTNLGIAFASRERWQEAIDQHTQSLSIDPKIPITLMSRGYAYRNIGQYDLAIADYSKAIELTPNDAYPYRDRGLCYFLKGENEKAIADFTQSIQRNYDYIEAFSNRSAAYLAVGKLDSALIDIDRAITLAPDYYHAYINRGAIYDKFNRPDDAIADFTKALQLNPKDAQAFCDRADIYAKKGQWEKAMVDYSNSIEVDPAFKNGYFGLGMAYTAMGQREKAIDNYSRLISLDPQQKLAYYNRGLCYGKTGQFEKAADDFTTVLRLDPTFTAALQNLEVAKRMMK